MSLDVISARQAECDKKSAMILKRVLLFFTLTSFLSGCIMVPKTHEFKEPKCELITKELTLDVVGLDINDIGHTSGDPKGVLGLLVVSGIVFTASVVVSGSIMVAGNTVHWIEQEGTCDDGKIRNAIADLSGSLASMGGWIVTSSKQMLDWITFSKDAEAKDSLETDDTQSTVGSTDDATEQSDVLPENVLEERPESSPKDMSQEVLEETDEQAVEATGLADDVN